MLSFATKYSKNVFSQCGEDGIIEEILKRIKRKVGVSVEFGAPTSEYCSNTKNLPSGWVQWFFDIDPKDPVVIKKEITTDNINELPACDVLSMDTDGPDYELWQAYKGNPDLVIIEINSSLAPTDPRYSREKGASYISMASLGISKGYFVVCHTGNIVFVRNVFRPLFPEIIGDGISNYSDYFKRDWL